MEVCSSMGSMRPPPLPSPLGLLVSSVMVSSSWVRFVRRRRPCVARPAGWPAPQRAGSDVEEADVFGVALDESATQLDVLAHEDREDLVGLRRVLERDLQHQPLIGVHRRLPQLLGVHLAEALVALDRVLLW